MPFYDFRCNICGETLPHFRKVEQRNIPEYHCATEMQRIISAPAIRPDIAAYRSPITGQWIDSRRQKHEELRREGCIENEPGLKAHIANTAKAQQEKAFRPIAEAVDREVSAMAASNLIEGD